MTMNEAEPLDPLPSYTVRAHRLDANLAELHITFTDLPPDVQVRGRVMGPRCPGSTTVEVSYPLRPLPDPSPNTRRIVIPEPVFWTAERPCVYEGPVEFLHGGELVGKITVSFGIKA
jgi:hypothetical protein